MLCPADQFLHACEHGQHHSMASALQWLADATLILNRHAENFNWPRVVDQARKFRLTLCVWETLRYLQVHFGVAVPANIDHELASAKVRWVERLELSLAQRPDALEHHLTRRVALAACHHLKAQPKLGGLAALKSFALYYRLLTHERREWPVVFREELITAWRRLRDEVKVVIFRAWHWLRFGSLPRGGLISMLPADSVTGFYKTETELASPFRWSEETASLRLAIPLSTTFVCLELRPLRKLKRLMDDGLEFAFDGQGVPRDRVIRRGRRMLITLDRSAAIAEGPHILSWKIRAWPAPGDPRSLGLPVCRVWTF